MWNFDAVSLYPSAMWDEKINYLWIVTGYAFMKDMNNDIVESFNIRNFTQGSALLKIVHWNPENFIVQHVIVKKMKLFDEK